MIWTKLGDEFGDECWTLSDPAFRLHTEGLCWSNRKGTDGQLAKDDMLRWAERIEAAEELVDRGYWEDHGQHYEIVHHIGYQRTSAQIAKQSRANRENRAKGKTRPVRGTSFNESSEESSEESSRSDESSEESSDEMDRTKDRTGLEERDPKKSDTAWGLTPRQREQQASKEEGIF